MDISITHYRVMCHESFNQWSCMICKKMTTLSSRITKIGMGYHTSWSICDKENEATFLLFL